MAVYRLKCFEKDSLLEMRCFDRTMDCITAAERHVGKWLDKQGRWVQLDVATRPSSEPAFFLVREATSMADWAEKLSQVRGGMN